MLASLGFERSRGLMVYSVCGLVAQRILGLQGCVEESLCQLAAGRGAVVRGQSPANPSAALRGWVEHEQQCQRIVSPSALAVFILMTNSNFVTDPPMDQTRIMGQSRHNL